MLYMYLTDSFVAILYSRLIQAYSDIVIEMRTIKSVLFKHVHVVHPSDLVLHHVKTPLIINANRVYVVFKSYSVLRDSGQQIKQTIFIFDCILENNENKCQRIHFWTQNHEILNPRK